MKTLLIIIGLIAAAYAIYALVKGLRAAQQERDQAAPQRVDPLARDFQFDSFSPVNLGPGAIVSYGGVDYVVRGTITANEGGFVWWEHLLQSEQGAHWLSVEEDDGQLELVWWTRSRTPLPGGPQPTLQVEGLTFYEVERGQAEYRSEGTTGIAPSGRMHYVDYDAAEGNRKIGLEQWTEGGGWEMSTGFTLREGELKVYPAPPASA